MGSGEHVVGRRFIAPALALAAGFGAVGGGCLSLKKDARPLLVDAGASDGAVNAPDGTSENDATSLEAGDAGASPAGDPVFDGEAREAEEEGTSSRDGAVVEDTRETGVADAFGSDAAVADAGLPGVDAAGTGLPGVDAAGADGACSVGSCPLSCPAGFTLCGGACVDLGADLNHCGACESACASGYCRNGTCEPVVLLARNQYSPGGITVDPAGGNVYWVNQDSALGAVDKCAIAGCAQQPIVLANGGAPVVIASDAANLYWIDDSVLGGGVKSCSTAGCVEPTTLWTAPSFPTSFGIALYAGSAYWTLEGGSVMTCPVGGCPPAAGPTTLASGQNFPWGVAVNGTGVYWANRADPGGLMRCGLGGGDPVLLWGLAPAYGVAVDASNVYWTSVDPDGSTGAVLQMALSGPEAGIAVTLVSGSMAPYLVAVDASNVYFTDAAGGTLGRCAIGGCSDTPTTIARADEVVGGVAGLAMDSANVYFTDGLGDIVEIAKSK